MSKKYKILFLIILFLSIGLRIGLVSVNREANDPHDEVITYIIENNALPEKDDCWECFQPKLFHYTTAKILQIPLLEEARTDQSDMVLQLEIINLIASIFILITIAVFIHQLPVGNENLKLISFALVALNPKLIGINAQFTNDTFAILFSSLALYFTSRYLMKQKWSLFLLMIVFTILGISTKTNVWVIAIAIFMSLLVKAWTGKEKFMRIFLIAMLYAISTLTISTLNPLNQYIHNMKEHDAPVLLNMEKKEFPNYFHKTEVGRPGILSIYDGFFSFRYFDLLQHPLIEVGESYTPTRTSLWTMLYARTHSLHFSNYPETWAAEGEKGFNLSRAIFIFALPPTILILFGFLLEIFYTLKSFFKRDKNLSSNHLDGLSAITFFGYVSFIIIYALSYRDFSVMKPVFMYPAILFLPVFFMRTVEFIRSWLGKRFQWMKTIFVVWMGILFVLYTVEVMTMIELISSRMV